MSARRGWHIEQAAALILDSIATKSETDYQDDVWLRSGVERQLMIIGEAIRHAVQVDPALAQQISDVPRIIALRNQLVHNYPQIEPTRIWEIVQNDLPRLLAEVRALLSQSGPNPA